MHGVVTEVSAEVDVDVWFLPPKALISLVGPNDVYKSNGAIAKPWPDSDSLVRVLYLDEERSG